MGGFRRGHWVLHQGAGGSFSRWPSQGVLHWVQEPSQRPPTYLHSSQKLNLELINDPKNYSSRLYRRFTRSVVKPSYRICTWKSLMALKSPSRSLDLLHPQSDTRISPTLTNPTKVINRTNLWAKK